ncbi:hypothetical protein PF008_g8824 [Phytophthora fragariae]|uniref:Uncharacterized protein n=1 Tax=Phytophthora fragariae TaxID=53985 RepID=A0A6G0RYJ0_9STRA|nr:hypothetical protein PF008_g8824 [Phytophthora fragariae]
MKYRTWYDTRRVMVFTAMVLSLDMNLRDLFKVDDLKDQMEVPSLLWGASRRTSPRATASIRTISCATCSAMS